MLVDAIDALFSGLYIYFLMREISGRRSKFIKKKERVQHLPDVCRLHHSGENPSEKIKYKIELTANTVAFIRHGNLTDMF